MPSNRFTIFTLCLLIHVLAVPASAQWTAWLNRDSPNGDGDYETLADLGETHGVCGKPVDIECRTRPGGVSWEQTGDAYSCTPERGGVCLNDDQPDGRCHDYEVRFLCGPGVADSCCCGASDVWVDTDWPDLNWALETSGHLLRLWWDQGGHEERVIFDKQGQRPVAGTLHEDPFGDGVVMLTDAGMIARAVHKSGTWSTELLEPRTIRRLGGVRECGLATTLGGRFGGIWAVTDHFISRIWWEGGGWRHEIVNVGGHAPSIVPHSIHEIFDGRIAGLLDNGQRWNIWFENDDPRKMRFDYSGDHRVAVSLPKCRAR